MPYLLLIRKEGWLFKLNWALLRQLNLFITPCVLSFWNDFLALSDLWCLRKVISEPVGRGMACGAVAATPCLLWAESREESSCIACHWGDTVGALSEEWHRISICHFVNKVFALACTSATNDFGFPCPGKAIISWQRSASRIAFPDANKSHSMESWRPLSLQDKPKRQHWGCWCPGNPRGALCSWNISTVNYSLGFN